jgi:hypothetical protein
MRKQKTISIDRSTIELFIYLVQQGRKDGFGAIAFPLNSDTRSVEECLEGMAQSLGKAHFQKHALMIQGLI